MLTWRGLPNCSSGNMILCSSLHFLMKMLNAVIAAISLVSDVLATLISDDTLK